MQKKPMYGAVATAALLGLWAFALIWVPITAGAVFAFIQEIALGFAALMGTVATWFRQSTNEPHEKLVWGLASLIAVAIVVFMLVKTWSDMAPWVRGTLMIIVMAGVVVLVFGSPKGKTA
jgi:peptidoglycan/LPS O-acetylase OafA/YrhL